MTKFLSGFRFTTAQKTVLVVLSLLLLSYWWFSTHYWYRIDDRKIFVAAQALPFDYSCFKSLSGEIYCHHQDNGTQYLISPQNDEVYVVWGEDIIYLEAIVLSSTFTNSLHDSKVRQILPDRITRGENFIQFTPTVDEWKQLPHSQTWRIYD